MSLQLQNSSLIIEVAPSMGGKIWRIYNKNLDREFLWINNNIPFEPLEPGSEYDPNFIGGIDELIPNDAPENIDGIEYPDHGELWTTPLSHTADDQYIRVYGTLPLSGLSYAKTIRLPDAAPYIFLDYYIGNQQSTARHFLWKLHAALRIRPGDRLITSARKGQVVDPEYCRFKNERAAFNWPVIENMDASIVPAANQTMDFFYLFDTPTGNMQLVSENAVFAYDYDTGIFPYQWWFASYGGFLDHYTAILEPCTNMPMLVNDAVAQNQSAVLQPGESLQTTVRIYAGEKNNYLPL